MKVEVCKHKWKWKGIELLLQMNKMTWRHIASMMSYGLYTYYSSKESVQHKGEEGEEYVDVVQDEVGDEDE